MNKRFTCYLLCLLACYIVVTSYSSGPGSNFLNQTGSKGTTAGCSNGSCHTASTATTVTLEVDSALTFPVTHYVPGATYTVKIHGLNTTNKPAFGFQFSAAKGVGTAQTQAGTYSALPANTHTSTVSGMSLLEHSNPIAASGGIYNVTFTWTAPVAGSGNVSLYCALNAVNLDNNTTGDQFATTNATLTEIVCPGPAISTQPTPQIVCAGSPATFTVASTTAGATYQWRLNGNPIPGATNATYTILSAATAGTYTVMVSNTCGGTLSNSAALVVNPLPTPTITQTGLTLSTGTFTTYQWLKNGVNIPGATSSSYTVTSIGLYTVKVTNTNNCTNTSPGVNITSVGIDNVNSADDAISIYPNPATTTINISASQPLNIIVKDLMGRTVFVKQQSLTADIHQLAKGVYLLTLYDKNNNMLKQEQLIKN